MVAGGSVATAARAIEMFHRDGQRHLPTSHGERAVAMILAVGTIGPMSSRWPSRHTGARPPRQSEHDLAQWESAEGERGRMTQWRRSSLRGNVS